jgi:hypothetical protein
LQGPTLVAITHGDKDLLDYVIAVEGERAFLDIIEVYQLLD